MVRRTTEVSPMSTPTAPQPQALPSFWAKAVEDSLARVTGFWDEIAKLQGEAHKRAVTAIDETARLSKATLDYGMELSTLWRTMSLDVAGKLLGAADTKAGAKKG
jgi:hypothetical protein